MYKSHWLPKALAFTAALVALNLVACSQAKFKATQANPRQESPTPDNVAPFVDNGDSGQVASCTDPNNVFCNPGTTDTGFPNPPNPPGFTPPTVDTGTIYTNVPNAACYRNLYQNTTTGNISGVNIWLVVDSSRSFDEERMAVGRAVVRGFMDALRMNIPVTVSVIASHAPSSSYNGIGTQSAEFSPNIFYRHSSEPVSIQLTPNMNASQLAQAEDQLLLKLGTHMQESPISRAKRAGGSVDGMSWLNANGTPRLGPHSGSDELGLYNFMAAMRRASIPANNAWVVLFMSDENDVCMNAFNNHQDETEMFNKYCGNVSPQAAYNQAVSFAGNRTWTMGSLVYTGQAAVPAGIQHSVGRGYTDLMGSAGSRGLMIDLAARSRRSLQTLANELVQSVAIETNNAAGFHTHYPIYDSTNRQVSLAEVRQYVDSTGQNRLDLQVYVDGVQSNYTYDGSRSLIQPSNRGSSVEILFCTGN